MRYVIRACYDQRSHRLHYTTSGLGTDRATTWICGGDYAGDRRIRDADDLATLVREIDLSAAWDRAFESLGRTPSRDDGPEPIEPDEPDYDADYEADRLADRYERNVLGL